MPKLDISNTIDITPERFLNACSANELRELDLLLCSGRFRNKMAEPVSDAEIISDNLKQIKASLDKTNKLLNFPPKAH